MSHTVLVVVDEPRSGELLASSLTGEGFRVLTAQDGAEGLRRFYDERPDVVVLDLSGPPLDSYAVCERLRALSNVPILMVSARGGEQDVVRGFEAGADDYVVKPVRLKEFGARVRAALRRASMEPVASKTRGYDDGYLTVDLAARRVSIEGQRIRLTPTEYKLLAELVEQKGKVVEFRRLLESVWGYEYINDVDYLRVYVWHLRRKIERDPKNPEYIFNEMNIGYRFEPKVK